MTLSDAVLSTLAYHHIFDYPLTESEIHQYLIGKKASPRQVQKELTKLKAAAKIGERRGYFFLKNRPKIVELRLQRHKYSQEKLKRAGIFASLLKIIPTIKLVAISGALAMQNSRKKDDIDLVLISKENTLWTTRFLANLVLFPFKRKPQPSRLITNNKACLNVLIDESRLEIEPKNLYLAHEICQMKPLFDRDNTYHRFIKANRWVTKFLPNWRPTVEYGKLNIEYRKSQNPYSIIYTPVENFLRSFQLWYMRPKITSEKIGEHQLFFHPQNTQERILKEYQKRLKRLRIAS